MREIDTSKLIRYSSGKYRGKIDWINNIGAMLPFIYNDQKGEVEIVDYVKAIPMGTITVKYKDNILPMKTNTLTKGAIGNLINYYNYDYKYQVGDTLETKYNTKLTILNQIKLYHTKIYERGYTVKCLDCNHIYDIRETHITSCPMCSDRVSYPEKFIHNLLNQLNVTYEVEKKFDWAGWKRYDIYIPNINTIIEVHGLIHYVNMYKEDLKLRQQNDIYKYKLAIKNNISKYIVIDARESNINYIKLSVLDSELNNLYDLSQINWLQCHEYATKSIIKQVSDLWNENKTKEEISNLLNIPLSSVAPHLRTADELGYCIYDKYTNYINGKKNSNKVKNQYSPVRCINTGEIFESQILASKSYNIYKSGISECCRGRILSAGKHPITKEPLKWEYYYAELDIVDNI